MNQVKYMIHASLLILLIFSGYSFIYPVLTSQSFEAKDKPRQNISTTPVTDTKYPVGKKLFQQNCQSCHGLDRVLTGPALRDFTHRGPWNDKENIYKWINNPVAFMKDDAYTKSLQKQYGSTMTAFPGLTPADIDQIVSYLSE